jgi:hypothetical protein
VADTQPTGVSDDKPPFGVAFFVAIVDRLAKTYQNMQRNSDPSLIGLDMSAHNVLQEQLVADHSLIPPASGATVAVDRTPAILQVDVSACKFPAPQSVGQRVVIYNNAGGNCVITVNSASDFQNLNGATVGNTLTIADESIVELISVNNAGSLQWKILGGVAVVSQV